METLISAPCGGASLSRTRARIGRDEPLHGKLDQGHIAEETRIEHSRRHSLPRAEQPHAALAHADDGFGAVREPVGEETAEWSGRIFLLDARRDGEA